MSIIQIMVTIIIVTILVTVILGVASYAAYWLRRGRRPTSPSEVDDTPRYFYRYLPEDERIEPEELVETDPELAKANGDRLDAQEVAVGQGEGNGRTGF
jgi:Tfp pilus assembly protein PilE